jgi:hypothetical protein
MEPVSVTVFRVRTRLRAETAYGVQARDTRRGHENSDLGFTGGRYGS